jgi:hypothetical protein
MFFARAVDRGLFTGSSGAFAALLCPHRAAAANVFLSSVMTEVVNTSVFFKVQFGSENLSPYISKENFGGLSGIICHFLKFF